jgi:ABC-type Mn2+/Zn2+ transport system ATPase subunit
VSDNFLQVQNLTVGYGSRVVLPNISFALEHKSFTGLLGANGAGKSTLIKTLLGIIPPLGGTIKFVCEAGHKHVLGYTPQRDTLDPIYLLSSFEVALMGTCGRVGPARPINRAEKDWVRECLRETGAEALSEKLFSELSGGQKQRVLMARALAAKPDFLLLDEPTSGIDAAAREAIMELLQALRRKQELTILMASHDLPMVRTNVENVIWLHQGKLEYGPVKELLSPQKIEEIFHLTTD